MQNGAFCCILDIKSVYVVKTLNIVKKKARLRYDNVFKTAWTDEFHFIKHCRKGNKFAFCEFCRTATECTILRPSEKKSIFSWYQLIQ
jgi:hypothetical protein